MRPALPPLQTRTALREYITQYQAAIDGRLGVFLGFPDTGGEFETVVAINETAAFASASVIKLPILYTLYHRHDDDLDHLRSPHGITSRNRVGGSGLFHLLGPVEPSLQDLARAMVAISDNTATNELIDYLGMEAINDRATVLGMAKTRLRRRMMVTLGENELEPRRDLPDDEPANTTSPLDCARFFADLVHEATLSPAAYDAMRIPLEEQKYVNHAPRYLPYDTTVLHKTGWVPTAALDTGILDVSTAARDQPLVFSVFVDDVSHGADGGDVCAEIGEAVYTWLTTTENR